MTTAFQENVEPEIAQIYENSRSGEKYQILYLDESVVLLRSSRPGRNDRNVHRIERRSHFDNMIEAGQMEYLPDSNLDMVSFEEEQWSDVDHIGEKTQKNMYEAGIKTRLDVQQADDSELMEISGLGATGLMNLREFVK